MSHGGSVSKGLGYKGGVQWRQLQRRGVVHADTCPKRNGSGACPRCERESKR